MSSKAYLDTTIVADALLKRGKKQAAARAALDRYTEKLLPVYAIKEFKAGPLRRFVWFHNKLVQTKSHQKTIEALQIISRTPHRYLTSTALEALHASAFKVGKTAVARLAKKYGQTATLESILTDEYRYAVRTKIELAWRRRRSIATSVVDNLSCYREAAPFERRGLIELEPLKCNPDQEGCCLGPLLRSNQGDLQKLKAATEPTRATPEGRRRYQALRELIRRKITQPVEEDTCRDLGDAFFAFFAPADAVILTTNVKDHTPLAAALGKRVEAP